MTKCEACKSFEVQVKLKLIDEKEYLLCMNCLNNLIDLRLSQTQFLNLIESGHSKLDFLLHSDFYDDEGIALQPR